MPIPVIQPCHESSWDIYIHPPANALMWARKERGQRGKKTPTNPTKIVQIFYVLKTANSKGKKFKPLVGTSRRVPLPGKGCEIPSRGTMGEGVTGVTSSLSPCAGAGGNPNKAINRLPVTQMASYLHRALANNN